MIILVTRHPPSTQVLTAFEAALGQVKVVCDPEKSKLLDASSDLTQVLLLLSCYSTPSCVDGLIENKSLDIYDRINESFAERISALALTAETPPTVLVWGLDFCLLPKKLKQLTKCRIVYHIGGLWPPHDLLEIVPAKAKLLSGMLESDDLIFSGYDIQSEWKAAVIKVLGLTSDKNRIKTCRLSVIPYSPLNVAGLMNSELSSCNERILLSVDTGITSTHNLEIRLNAVATLIRKGVIDSARIIFTQEQSFGTDFAQVLLPDPPTRDPRFIPIFALAQRLNLELGAEPKIQLAFRRSEVECLKDCDAASALLIGEPYIISSRLLYHYLQSRVKTGLGSAPNHVPRVILSEHSAVAKNLALAYWPTFNPFSETDLVKKLTAAFSLQSKPDLRLTRTLRSLEAYTNLDWLRNIASCIEQYSAALPPSSPPHISDTPSEIINRFLDPQTDHHHKIIVCDVQGILGPAELTAANRLLLPKVVLQWDPRAGHPLIDLYLTTQIGINALQDVVGRIGFQVDADQGHLRKSIGKTDFTWISQAISQEESKPRLKHAGLELMKYYKDRTPGSFITKSETSLTFHVTDIQRMSSRTALQELTTQLQTGVVSRDPEMEMDVQSRSVRVSIHPRQQKVALQSGIEELRNIRSDLDEYDLLCIGSAALLQTVRGLWPCALTVGVLTDDIAEVGAEYLLKDYGEVVKLLKLVRETVDQPSPGFVPHNAIQIPAPMPLAIPDYTPSAVGVLDSDDTTPADTPPFLTPVASTPPL